MNNISLPAEKVYSTKNNQPKELEPISVQWVKSINEISDAFFDLCFRSPLEGRWWYHALESCGLEDQFEFAYALIFQGSQPIGIAPTFVMNVPMDLVAPPELTGIIKKMPLLGKLFPFLVYQRTLFIGSPCADEGTIGLLEGCTLSSILPVLFNAVEQRARSQKVQMIVWKDFAKHDCVPLDTLVNKHGYFKMPSYPSTMVPLPSGSFDDYLNTLKGTKRYKLKKKLKRSHQQGSLDVSIIQHPDDQALNEIFGLFWQTYEHGQTKFERLNPKFFHHIAALETSYFILLKNPDTDKLIAFMLCFKMGQHVINKFVGFDYAFDGNWFLYFRLWEAAVRWVMETGATEFQSGQTGYGGKLEIGHHLVPLTNYCKNLNPLLHPIYKAISRTVTLSTLDPDLAIFLKAHPADDETV